VLLFTQWHVKRRSSEVISDQVGCETLCDTLQPVHTKGYLHNNLKVNNVVLEDKSHHLKTGIIEFKKSTKIDVPMKKKTIRKDRQKIYCQSFAHITPEIIN